MQPAYVAASQSGMHKQIVVGRDLAGVLLSLVATVTILGHLFFRTRHRSWDARLQQFVSFMVRKGRRPMANSEGSRARIGLCVALTGGS